MKKLLLICLSGAFAITACQQGRKSEGSAEKQQQIEKTVFATVETDPMPQTNNEDAADDPAIWIHPTDASLSRIVGTDKKGGLAVYDLQGKELFYYKAGKCNNVDVRYNFTLAGDTLDIVAASNRTTRSLSLFAINPDGSLTDIADSLPTCKMSDEVYGFCLYHSPVSGKFYAFVNSKSGEIEQYELIETPGKKTGIVLVRQFALNSQVEGMVADDETGILYIGQEQKGIFRCSAEPDQKADLQLIAMSDSASNPLIAYDIEGLSIYYATGGKGYLVASIQGNYSYAVFEREGSNRYLTSFKIAGRDAVDAVEETDGLDVTNIPLGKAFPSGVLIVQDGFNKDEAGKDIPQNFKFVDWAQIARLVSPALVVDTTYRSIRR